MSGGMIDERTLYTVKEDLESPLGVKTLMNVLVDALRGEFTPTGLRYGGWDTIIEIPTDRWVRIQRSSTSNPVGTGIKDGRNSLKMVNIGDFKLYTTVNEDPNDNGEVDADPVGANLQALPLGDPIQTNEVSQILEVTEKNGNSTEQDPLYNTVWARAEGEASDVGELFFRELS